MTAATPPPATAVPTTAVPQPRHPDARRRLSPYKARFKDDVMRFMVMHPSWNDSRVAAEFGVHRNTIGNIRRKFEVRVDYELAQKLAGRFLAEFTQAGDYFKGKIDEAEAAIEELRARLAAEPGMAHGDAVAIHMAMDRLRHTQLEFWKSILEAAGQGATVEGLRVLRDAEIRQN